MSEGVLRWPETAVPNQDAPYADAATLALIQRCLAGDESAFGQLYDIHAAAIYRLTMSMLQHREDAEEVLQDSFDYAFRKLAQYDPHKSAFKTWLYRIAISRCRNKRRRKWLPTFDLNQITGPDAADRDAVQPDEALTLSEEQQRVWQALQ
ncbi:MAG: RNA polymerase sigma factor, partial [Anaerolineae bacterium]